MKKKDKKNNVSERKKSRDEKDKNARWFDRKKIILIRKNALKKIYEYFKDQENDNY